MEVSGNSNAYTVKYINDVTYKSFSAALHLIKGGINAGDPSWKYLDTNKRLKS